MIVLVRSLSKLYLKNRFTALCLSLVLFLASCERNKVYIDITGPAMGTSYTIRLLPKRGSNQNVDLIKAKIDSTLESINNEMSTYVINSDISLFNKLDKNAAIVITNNFRQVILQSIYWSKQSNGAFDISSLPLTTAWRKGKKDREYEDKWEPPSDLEITTSLDKVGFEKIKISQNSLIKTLKGQQIDVNAIAKGWGVDHLFNLIKSFGYSNFMVEIGGEVRVSGKNINNKPWQIGIDYPVINTKPGEKIMAIAPLIDKSMATSGNYRNFYQIGDSMIFHTIDPTTGYPAYTNMLSASVFSKTCFLADAYATSFMVMGFEKSKQLSSSIDEIEVLLIYYDNNGEIKKYLSEGIIEKIKLIE